MTTETLDRRAQVESLPLSRPATLHRFALLVAIATYVLVVAGGVVTSTDSGDADPHWPSFSGRLSPSIVEMVSDPALLIEHKHRLIAGIVGLLTAGLAVLLWRKEPRRWVRWLGVASVVLVVILAVFGGVRVLSKMRHVAIVHVALAMPFLALNTALAVVTGPGWFAEERRLAAAEGRRLAGLAIAALGAIYVQVVLGAIPRHAMPGATAQVMVGDALHITWAFAVFTLVVLVAAEVMGKHQKARWLFRPAAALLFLLVLQFFLGFITFITQPKDPAIAASGLHESAASIHQAMGALMLLSAVVLAVRILGLRGPSLEGSDGMGAGAGATG